MMHADDDPVTYRYASSANISFRDSGIETGYTWGQWREMSRKERDEVLTDALFELVDIFIEGDER